MKRGVLLKVYASITDAEKKQWASTAGYASHEGLYCYLRKKQDSNAYERIVEALENVIELDRAEKIINSIIYGADVINEQNVLEYTKMIISTIAVMKNKDKIEKIKQAMVSVCDSQLSRLSNEQEEKEAIKI